MKLKEFLTHHNVPIQKLSDLTGISTVSIRNYLNGSMPSVENAFKIEKATLGIVKAKDFVEQKRKGNR